MMDSFEGYLGPVAAGVAPELISPSAFSDIRSVAGVLPGTLAYNTFGFECRLGEELPRADFLVLANAYCGRDSLAGLHPTSPLPPRLSADPIWRRVAAFASRWADASSLLYNTADNVWLEFDVEGPAPDVPVPSLFFGPRTDGRDGGAALRPDVEGYRATIVEALRPLSGGEPPAGMLETMSGCLRALAPDDLVFQVGLMMSRGAEAVRLCIRPGSVERITEYLAEVGWTGSGEDLRAILEPVERLVDYVCLDIDVGDTVHPKIGLECYIRGPGQARIRARWEAFSGFLLESGLCTPDKREALLAYPGYIDENAEGVSWPVPLRRASLLLGGRSLSMFVRSIHHVKIVCQQDRPTEAKAYLAANHHWHTRAEAENTAPREPMRT
jgi:hypothetical protein